MSRPNHNPTEDTRRTVLICSASGVKHDSIARAVGVSQGTLRKHYRAELDSGAVTANAAVAESLYQLAIDGNVTAAIFWLKTRAGWRERPAESEPDTPRNGPLTVIIQGRAPEDTDHDGEGKGEGGANGS